VPQWLATAFSGASVAAAWIALALAFVSTRTGRKALRIAQAESDRKVPRLVPYLIDSVAIRDNATQRTIEIVLSLSNPSDSSNTISRADLALSHVVQNHALVQLLIPAAINSANDASNLLTVPLRINAHATVAGRLRFTVPNELVDAANVRRYELQLTDSQGAVVPLELRVLKEIAPEGH